MDIIDTSKKCITMKNKLADIACWISGYIHGNKESDIDSIPFSPSGRMLYTLEELMYSLDRESTRLEKEETQEREKVDLRL